MSTDTDTNASKRETASEEDVLAKLRASLEKEPPQKQKKNTVQDKDLESALLSAIASVTENAEKPKESAAAPDVSAPAEEPAEEVSFDDIFGAAFAEDIPPQDEPVQNGIRQDAPAKQSVCHRKLTAAEKTVAVSEADFQDETAAAVAPENTIESVPADLPEPTTEPEAVTPQAPVGTPVEPAAETPAEMPAAPAQETAAEPASAEPEAEPAEEKDLPLEQFNAYLASLLETLPQQGQPRLFTEEEAFSALNQEEKEDNPAPAAPLPQEQITAADTPNEPAAGGPVSAAPAAQEPAAAQDIPAQDNVTSGAPAQNAAQANPTPHVKWVGTVPDQPTQAAAAQQKPAEQTAAPQDAPVSSSAAAPEAPAAHDNRENMTARNIADTIAANLRRREEEIRRAGKEPLQGRDLSDEDMALMMHLGYEADLARVTGYKPIEKMKRGTDEDASIWPPYDTKYSGVEYDMSSEKAEAASREKVKHRFRVNRVFNALRIIITLFLSLFALYYDITPVMHVPFLSYLSKTERPVFYMAFGALLLAVSVLLSGRTILRGAKRLFVMQPNSVSVPIVISLSLLLYDAVAVLTGAVDALQLNSIGVISMLAVTIRDAMYVKAEKEAFGVISSTGTKYAVEPLYEPMSGSNQNTNKGRPRMMWLSRPVRVIRHFRARFHEAEPYEKTLPYMLPLAILLSLAAGLLGLLRGNTLFVAYSWAQITLLCLLPAFVTIHLAYPWLMSERFLAKRQCAMIGRNAPWLYVGPSMLLFPDETALEARNSTEMHVKNAGDTTLYISRLHRLFDEVGGTLAGILAKSPITPTVEQVRIVEVTPFGLQADFIGMQGGQPSRAVVGTWKFMQSNGVNAPTEDDTRIKRNSKDTGLLYAAFDGELKLIFEVEYGVYAGFLGTVPGLSEYGIATGLYTEDPVLNDVFVSKCLGVASDDERRTVPVNVLKPRRHRELPLSEETSSALIACGSAAQTAHGLVAAAGLRQICRIGTLMRWLAMIVGGLLALDMMLLSDMGSMPALRVLLLQLIWLLPVGIITRLYLIRDGNEDKDNKNGKKDSVTGAGTNGGRKGK